MRQRQVGWALLALGVAGWLFASCGSDANSSGVNAGLGVKCASDKDCTPYSLLCDKTLFACTECSVPTDCAAGQTCAGNRCRAIVTCNNSLDCPGQVCDRALSPAQCVGCMNDDDCSRSTYCFRTECVPLGSTGSGGSGAAGSNVTVGAGGTEQGTGGVASGAGGGSGVGGNVSMGMGGAIGTGGNGGAVGSGGNGGAVGSGGAAGSGGNGGHAGSVSACMCAGGQQCTVDDKCVFAHDIHTATTCDGTIAQVSGRSGKWYAYASAGDGYQLGIGDPGPTWHQHTCAVYFVGGPNGSLGLTNSAGIGVQLASGGVYSLTSYTGIRMTIEGGQRTLVIVKTLGGGYFGAYAAATGTAPLEENVLFAQMLPLPNSLEATLNLATATEIQFGPEFPAMSWGFALYAISFTP